VEFGYLYRKFASFSNLVVLAGRGILFMSHVFIVAAVNLTRMAENQHNTCYVTSCSQAFPSRIASRPSLLLVT